MCGVRADGCEFLQVHPQNRRHGSDAHRNRLLHVFAAVAHGAHGVGKAERSGGHVRGVFSQAVPGDEAGVHAPFLQHPPGRNRRGQDGGLRDFRHPQLFFRTLKAQLGQLVAEGFVGLIESLPGDGIFFRQFFAHPDGLRSLAGEEECDLSCGHVLLFRSENT